MTQDIDQLFDEGLNRYQAGEAPESLIPVFQEICDRSPKGASGWICLAWLYLLVNQPKQAYKAASRAVKLKPEDPQAQMNFVLAMLETGQKGVRPHVELIQKLMGVAPEIREEIQKNCEDGLTRKPDWQNMKRFQGWLFGA